MLEEYRAPFAVASPRDELDWGATLHPSLLQPGEVIETISWAARSEDTAVGLLLEPRPSETDPVYGLVGYVLISIASAERGHERWEGRGRLLRPIVTIGTNRDRVWSRELPILVVTGATFAGPRPERVLVIGDA